MDAELEKILEHPVYKSSKVKFAITESGKSIFLSNCIMPGLLLELVESLTEHHGYRLLGGVHTTNISTNNKQKDMRYSATLIKVEE